MFKTKGLAIRFSMFALATYTTVGAVIYVEKDAVFAQAPTCSKTLPTDRTCNVGRGCTLAPRSDGNCGTYIQNIPNTTYAECTGAEEGDHCVNATNQINCGIRRSCIKRRKQQVVEEYECVVGGANRGYVKKNHAIDGGHCTGGNG